MIVGVPEDSATETGPAWDALHEITRRCPRCAIVICHHANKAGGLSLIAVRGSSRFAGEVDVAVVVQVHTLSTDQGELHALVDGRDLPRHLESESTLKITFPIDDPTSMSAQGFRIETRTVGRESKSELVRAVFDVNPEETYSKAAVARVTGISPSTAGEHVDALQREGFVSQVSKGKYRRSV
jgi:hypothetical protein